MWSRERNRGFGSNPVPPQCGPGRETVGLGQALVAGNVVQGEKPRVWVKPWWWEMWSREQNRGFGSNLGGGKCGPGRETAAPGQTQPRPSVVQGEKLRPRVKPWWREMWSRERNCGFGSSLGGGKCGPGSKTAVLGQTRPRPSMVQGEKPRPRVNPGSARVWSRERNRGPGSSPAQPECGPGRETVAPGQTRPRRSVVQGEKPRPRVKLCPARSVVRGVKLRPGSNPAPPQCGPGRKTAAPGQPRPSPSVVQGEKPWPQVKPGPAAVWSREQNCGPGSNPAPPKYGPGRETAAPGQTRPRPSMAQGEKSWPRVKPSPAEAWSSHLKYKKESKQTYERWIYQSRSDCPGQ